LPLSPTSQGRYSPIGTDPFYSHHAALPGSSLFNYVRPRYHDDSYRRQDERAHSPPRYSLLTTFCGSPLYASPEIINGTPYKGPEVDCWSLGILLYTLVYGSMPFDGRDFNRMVRQIKRGAYYEPDTPSTASMLIRNMLRVNPERRADIFDIASHWWLNLEENMPVIQELPENQITDLTPLTERAETMVVQSDNKFSSGKATAVFENKQKVRKATPAKKQHDVIGSNLTGVSTS
ncbi:hypothetical protein COOONC_05067, partial [Cooperia oncophora]